MNSDQELLKKVEKSYLGIVIIKPIEDIKFNPLIGRTILRTYPQDINSFLICFDYKIRINHYNEDMIEKRNILRCD